MKFKYKQYGPALLRPVIPVEVVHRGLAVPYEVLVDSGADICLFDAQIAEILGIDVADGENQQVGGIVGTPETYYIHQVKIKVGGWVHSIRAGFLPGISKFGYGVVGQNGFFDIFIAKFDLLKAEVELKDRKAPS
jgi:hypothetical protein